MLSLKKKLPANAYAALAAMQSRGVAARIITENLLTAATMNLPLAMAEPSAQGHVETIGIAGLGRSVFAERTWHATQAALSASAGWVDSIEEALRCDTSVSLETVDDPWLERTFSPASS